MKKIHTFLTAIFCLIFTAALLAQETGLQFELSPSSAISGSRFTVTATVMDNDTWCRVQWPDPVGNPMELWYDDNEADDYFIWADSGNMTALKFLSFFDNYIVTGGRIHVGDGSFPGPFLGTSFRVLVYDDDGEDGLPGTVIDSADVIVNNYGWVEFEGLTAQFAEGDFYLAMKQLAPNPDAAPIGVDMDNPTYFRSYIKFPDTTWLLSPLQDFMIRASVTAYNEPVKAIDSFEVARFSGFEMNESPLTGDTTVLDTTIISEYNDYEWDDLNEGLYAYGVRTHFTNGQWSDYDVSNNVIHLFYLYPPSCFYQEDDLLLIACPPLDTNGNIPENAIGLYLYRDMEFTGYISFLPDPPPFPVEIPIDFQPGIYNYTLTAVYDLIQYGYPGETGESSYLSTQVNISYGFPLPFLEQWNDGTFETNEWLPEGENWSINWQEGQPGPSAEFTWDPIQSDYEVSLESYPLLAISLTEGSIYLDFILKLDNFQPSGTEQMQVQVWNWETQVWNTVSAYSNEDGSFGWLSEHLNITDQAMGKVFKIRFVAIGESSLNILGWYVDNIHVYRECTPPFDLEAYLNYSPFFMFLDWEAPSGTNIDDWIHWDDGVNYNSIGIPTGEYIDVASRWEPAHLNEFEGATIKQVAFFPTEASSEYHVKVWIGENAANLILDQLVESPEIDEWNQITINPPLPLFIDQELWIGYTFYGTSGAPAGVDNGPAIDGYGNLIRIDGEQWETLLNINPVLNYNWNISAYLQSDTIETGPDLFAIYRSDRNMPFYLRDYTDHTYYMDDSAICEPLGSTHFYKITALYFSELDTCESAFTYEAGDFCEGESEMGDAILLNIYPNPASNVLYIESAEEIKRLSIFDSRGGSVETGRQGDKETGRIDVGGLAPGLYLVRVETVSGVVGRKVVKNR